MIFNVLTYHRGLGTTIVNAVARNKISIAHTLKNTFFVSICDRKSEVCPCNKNIYHVITLAEHVAERHVESVLPPGFLFLF